jgi:hydrogenase expression/formation protein HypE
VIALGEVLKLEHGGGGSLMRGLLEKVIVPAFKIDKVRNGIGLPEMDDGASIPVDGKSIVITTDASTVRPLFFPGGDIGKLAICGAVNDLSMMGAEPLAVASTITAEEGLTIETLRRILGSMNEVLEEVGIPLIAGDTKVVERGGLDEILINTTGLGITENPVTDSGLKPGNKIIISGTVGNHQLALLSMREGLKFEAPLESDIAPLWGMVKMALGVGGVTAMKDPTRGGVSAALNDMARKSGVDVILQEDAIPLKGVVRSASEMLGLDPLELANEGVAVIGVEEEASEGVLKAIRKNRYGVDAEIVGEVDEGSGRVILETYIGGRRIVREPYGSPMPRIC